MKLTIHPLAGADLEVEATSTNHPELAIHEIPVREFTDDAERLNGLKPSNIVSLGKELGKIWAVSHISTGEIVVYGLLTKDLAIATAEMLVASGIKFGPETAKPYLLDAFQAAASLMADCYFEQFFKNTTGRLVA